MNINLSAIEAELLQLITSFADRLPEHDVRELSSLAQAGEPGVALENLCTQLYEYDVQVSAPVLERLLRLGESMELDLSRWSSRLLAP